MGLGISTDPDDNVYVIGRQRGAIDISGQPQSPGGAGDDLLVVKYDPNGDYVWSLSYGGGLDDIPWGIAVNDDGKVFVTGEYRGQPPGLDDAGDNMDPALSAPLVMKLAAGGSKVE
jgi:hypothetical protein